MSFGHDDSLFAYPDTFYTVTTTWIWNIGTVDKSKIEVKIENGRDVIHRQIIWDWNKLNIGSSNNLGLDLEVALTDSACQVVADTVKGFLNIVRDIKYDERHDVYIIVHCVFDKDDPLSSYLELRTQDLARMLAEYLDSKNGDVYSIDISGHTCSVGLPERNQRLSMLRTMRTDKTFRNYLKLIKNFQTDEELLQWLGCDITQSSWSCYWPYRLREDGERSTRDPKSIDLFNLEPDSRVANRRAEIEIVKRLRQK
jgi:hypothetical protein